MYDSVCFSADAILSVLQLVPGWIWDLLPS
jgi:hypothetical protein